LELHSFEEAKEYFRQSLKIFISDYTPPDNLSMSLQHYSLKSKDETCEEEEEFLTEFTDVEL